MVVVEASGRPLLALERRPHGRRAASAAISPRASSRALAETAGLTLHVRLIEGEDTDHVLEAIFKSLGCARWRPPTKA